MTNLDGTVREGINLAYQKQLQPAARTVTREDQTCKDKCESWRKGRQPMSWGEKNDLKFGNRQKDARFLCRVEGVVVAQSA